jgi:hypothetical protein
MTYYVISPNVFNDGNIARYLDEMKDRHIAIMGCGKDDSKKGDLFAKMKIGDRVVIAHGANRNKKVYYAGIVASKAKSYKSDGKSQYVELYNFKDISLYRISFTEKNTYGASNRISSIYRLKNNVDANIIATIEQILSIQSFNIRDIEFWARQPNRYISIPALQRGLVWKPRQVELLWDSILRYFPIGSLMLSENAEDSHVKSPFYLIDGQQRFNAIALGYNAYESSKMTSIVWFDLNPAPNPNSTRKYWVKLTTKSHPWGYKNDDECSTLTAGKRRDALIRYGMKDLSTYNSDFDLKQTYPIEAKCPIPLYWLLKAPTMNEDVFTEYVLNKFEFNKKDKAFKLPFDTLDADIIRQYYNCFHRIKDYTINTNLLKIETFEDETESQNADIADIEVLFNRIGAGGTPISKNELIYSAIKAYWTDDIKETNDELAALYMPPVTLIMLAFRLSLTTPDDKCFKDTPSIKQVRQIAQERGEQYDTIIHFYRYEAEGLLSKVNQWLTRDDAPTVIRTDIAKKCPDIYLLLMYIARKDIINNEDDTRFVQALAYYIYWFGKDNCSRCVNVLYNEIKDSNTNNFKSKIIESILILIQKQYLSVLYSPELFYRVFSEIPMDDPDWLPEKNNNSSKPWWPFWKLICYNKDLLLYAQRKYLKENFSLYDPAKSEMWDGHNRPWDYDHIIPKDWIHKKSTSRKKYTKYCEAWLNCNGNLAAIPFEKNRGKSNSAEWDEYIANKKDLLCDDDIGIFKQLFNKNIQTDKEQAHRFAVKTKNRTIRIYQECYGLLHQVFEKGIFSDVDSDFLLAKRKATIESLCAILGKQAHVYFTYKSDKNNGEKIELVTNEMEWAMPKLIVGISNGHRMACFYFNIINNNADYNYWVGIGRALESSKDKELTPLKDYQVRNDDWWYFCKEFNKETPIEEIAKEINELTEYMNS